MSHPRKILVTGGAGFIGSHLVDAYLAAGHEVVVIDNLSTGKREHLAPAVKFFEADITDREAVTEIILQERPQVINHHAAHIQVGYSVTNPQFDATNNILGLLNVMEAAKQIPIQRLIFAATGGAMYGNQPTPFHEEMKAEPLSPYGVSKRAGELYLNYYYQLYQLPYLSLRYANVYGPRQNAQGESGVVAIFSELLRAGKEAKINGDGTHTRDYVYVSDVARANLMALETEFVGEINIGTGVETSTNQVFELVTEAMGLQREKVYAPERPGEQVTSALDASRAAQVLGWRPEVSFAEGVLRLAQSA